MAWLLESTIFFKPQTEQKPVAKVEQKLIAKSNYMV
jgi:hypothetical protein